MIKQNSPEHILKYFQTKYPQLKGVQLKEIDK